jgi:Tol biopolymer transport system component
MGILSILRTSTDSHGNEAEGHGLQTHLTSICTAGSLVGFQSYAYNLVPGDTNATQDIFLKDLQTGETTRVSSDSDGNQGHGLSTDPVLSGDGRFIAYCSLAPDLVSVDTNHAWDVFTKDLSTGETMRISTDSDGNQGNGHSTIIFRPSISADGRFVVFESLASNLVPGDTNGVSDIFVKDLKTGRTSRVSTNSNGDECNGVCKEGTISADGRYVAFESDASNLVPGDRNGVQDIFVKDLLTGATTRVTTDSAGAESNGFSRYPAISPNGRFVGYESDASNLVAGDTNKLRDAFMKDLVTGETTLIARAYDGGFGKGGSTLKPLFSEDGRFVAFHGSASNIVPGDVNGKSDIFVRDMKTGETVLVSTDIDGNQGNGNSRRMTMTLDGRTIAFDSEASNLVPGDTNDAADSFVAMLAWPDITTPGTDADDRLTGTPYADSIIGVAGNDLIFGDWGDDTLRGGSGQDSLNGGDGDDSMAGNTGADWLNDGSGLDRLDGGADADVFALTAGDNAIDEILGFDGTAGDRINLSEFGVNPLVSFADHILTVNGEQVASIDGDFDASRDLIVDQGANTWIGTDGADSYTGGDADEVLIGLAGNDTLDSGRGDDRLDGGDGNDKLSGKLGDDTLNGGDGNDTLNGGWGSDTLRGDAGNDRLDGSAGDNLLVGGDGRDRFIYGAGPATNGTIEMTTIADYHRSDGDVIDLPDAAASVAAKGAALVDGAWQLTLVGDGDVIRLDGIVDVANDGIFNDLVFV